jgi:hypothetical protein
MAGVTKSHPGGYERTFPHSRYNDPRGGRHSALERNVLRYRAVETALYLYYAEEVRRFVMTTIYPAAIRDAAAPPWETIEEQRLWVLIARVLGDAELAGTLSSADAQKVRHACQHDPKQGNKLRKALRYAVDTSIFTASEADELVELLDYRNDIAHRVHLVMSDLTRSYGASEFLAYDPPLYKGDALDRLRGYKKSLWGRTRHMVHTLSMDGLMFDHAERFFEEELGRLEELIQKQILLEKQRFHAVRAELDLSGTDLVGELDPRFPLNFHQNGHDGATDTGHLTRCGAEICYRLFDLGKSPLAVAYLMGMSLRAAQRRRKRWREVGGQGRTPYEIERLPWYPKQRE